MKKLAAVFTLTAIAGTAGATIFTYDFGTGTGAHTSNSSSTDFLPQPSSGGGEDRVRVGSTGGGIYLENPGDAAVGSDTELRINAPTTTSVNMMQVYDYTAAKSFSFSATLKLTGGASGSFYLFFGDGAMYSDNTQFSGAQVFTGIRWTMGASDTVTTSYRNSSAWVTDSGTPFAQNSVYTIEVYGNNTTSGIDYTKDGAQTVAAGSWDLWINGTLVGNDIVKAGLSADVNIDSFKIYGESSSGNASSLILDDITYANEITVIPEPSSIGMLGLAGFGFLLRRFRRTK